VEIFNDQATVDDDNTMFRTFVESGFGMLHHLLGALVLDLNDDGCVKLSIGGLLHVAVDFKCDRNGQAPDYEKDRANIESLTLLNEEANTRVYIRIDPYRHSDDDENSFEPLARWLVLRDLIVMLYRMFEKNEFLGGVGDSLFYLFYKKDSILIDSARNPYIVSTAVSLPTTEISAVPRRFTDWECMMDPLLAHFSGKDPKFPARHLFLHLRVPLDNVHRTGVIV
jgi:hypothetical protein